MCNIIALQAFFHKQCETQYPCFKLRSPHIQKNRNKNYNIYLVMLHWPLFVTGNIMKNLSHFLLIFVALYVAYTFGYNN